MLVILMNFVKFYALNALKKYYNYIFRYFLIGIYSTYKYAYIKWSSFFSNQKIYHT